MCIECNRCFSAEVALCTSLKYHKFLTVVYNVAIRTHFPILYVQKRTVLLYGALYTTQTISCLRVESFF
ncbi:MAG: hypothetical protein UV60_C0003G0035 [Parcubacteria group bacterium GW2011_GWA2_43_11]|nr:MAG: hypothetical protein UV60_C0003G0035 [Parcubacteria group bacterium GW2011_GWA2_43_11]